MYACMYVCACVCVQQERGTCDKTTCVEHHPNNADIKGTPSPSTNSTQSRRVDPIQQSTVKQKRDRGKEKRETKTTTRKNQTSNKIIVSSKKKITITITYKELLDPLSLNLSISYLDPSHIISSHINKPSSIHRRRTKNKTKKKNGKKINNKKIIRNKIFLMKKKTFPSK